MRRERLKSDHFHELISQNHEQNCGASYAKEVYLSLIFPLPKRNRDCPAEHQDRGSANLTAHFSHDESSLASCITALS